MDTKYVFVEEMYNLIIYLVRNGIRFQVEQVTRYDITTDTWTITDRVMVKDDSGNSIIDAISNPGSYGWLYDRNGDGNLEHSLEVMAHGTYSPITNNDVIGYLNGYEAFELFEKAWRVYKGEISLDEE